MQIPFLPPGSLLLLPAVVSLGMSGDPTSPWYLAALALSAWDGAENFGRIFPQANVNGRGRWVGLVVALGTAHFLAEGMGGCCASGR